MGTIKSGTQITIYLGITHFYIIQNQQNHKDLFIFKGMKIETFEFFSCFIFLNLPIKKLMVEETKTKSTFANKMFFLPSSLSLSSLSQHSIKIAHIYTYYNYNIHTNILYKASLFKLDLYIFIIICYYNISNLKKKMNYV